MKKLSLVLISLIALTQAVSADNSVLNDILRRSKNESERKSLTIEQRLEKATHCDEYNSILEDISSKDTVTLRGKKVDTGLISDVLFEKLEAMKCIPPRRRL